MKRYIITLIFIIFSFSAFGFDSILKYETNAQQQTSFGYLGTIDNCLTSGKMMTVFQFDDLKNNYIPKIQSPDEAPQLENNYVYNRVIAGTVIRGVIYAQTVTWNPFAWLAMAVEYLMMVDICTNAYVLQPHEYVNRDMLDLECAKDDSNEYYFAARGANFGGQPVEPFSQLDIPYYYTCDPTFDVENPATPITDDMLLGRNYGYIGETTEFCTGDREGIAADPRFNRNIGSIAIEFVPGTAKFFSGNYGSACKSQHKLDTLFMVPDGETQKMPGYALYDWYSYYRYDTLNNKVEICAVAPYTMAPIVIGCSHVPPPAAVSPVDGFVEDYLANSACSYFLTGRNDLKSLAKALPENDSDGNNKIFIKRFLNSEFHLTSTVTSCLKDMLYRVFVDDEILQNTDDNRIQSTPNPAGDTTLFVTVRDGMRGLVFAVLVLYVAISGISLIIDPELYRKRGEVLMLVIKFALVFYFAVGNAWYERDSSGKISGLLPAFIEAPAEFTSIIFNAYNQNDPIGYCKYKLGGDELFQQRVVEESEVNGALKNTHGYDGVKMTVFDLIDCKLVNYFNFGSCKYGIDGIVGAWLGTLSFWAGGVGFLMAVVSFIYLFLLMLIIFKLVHVFILSMFVIVILIFFAPVFVLFALFKATFGIFQTWFRMLIGYAIYPAFSFVFVAFMLTSLDLVYYGSLDENYSSGTGGFYNLKEACAASEEPSVLCTTIQILGSDNPCTADRSTLNDKFFVEKDLAIVKVRALKDEIAQSYMVSFGKLLLFALLFYLLLNSMLYFIAVVVGVWAFDSAKGGVNIMNPFKAIFGGGNK